MGMQESPLGPNPQIKQTKNQQLSHRNQKIDPELNLQLCVDEPKETPDPNAFEENLTVLCSCCGKSFAHSKNILDQITSEHEDEKS